MSYKTKLYYFSPTGGTKKIGELFAGAFAGIDSAEMESVDLGKKEMPRGGARGETEGGDTDRELAVVAAPVFGGRIPSVMREKLLTLDGAGREAVAIVVYGNRDYDDALLELYDVLTDRGFSVVAAGAFVAQHSMVPDIAVGRPDSEDEAEIRDFAARVLEKLMKVKSAEETAGLSNKLDVPGKHPYKPEMDLPFTPISLDGCVLCGKCAEACPTGAIELKGGTLNTDVERCIICMTCVHECPKGARSLPDALYEKTSKMLEPFRGVRNLNEVFLS